MKRNYINFFLWLQACFFLTFCLSEGAMATFFEEKETEKCFQLVFDLNKNVTAESISCRNKTIHEEKFIKVCCKNQFAADLDSKICLRDNSSLNEFK